MFGQEDVKDELLSEISAPVDDRRSRSEWRSKPDGGRVPRTDQARYKLTLKVSPSKMMVQKYIGLVFKVK